MGSEGPTPGVVSVLLPTRGRVQMARAFLDSLADHAADLDRVEVILYVDDDDQDSARIAHPRLSLTTIVGPSGTCGSANTACLRRSNGSIVMLANDDVVVCTPRWDATIREVDAGSADGMYLSWVNDGFKRHRMSTFPVLSRRACEVMVEPYPAVYESAFIDYELFDIFTRLRRLGHDRLVYRGDVLFEHRHHRTGKRAFDATARRRRRFADDFRFLARSAVRQRQAERLAAAIEGRPIPALVESAAVPSTKGLSAVPMFASTFFGDRGLPPARRAYLFAWYCGRYAASLYVNRDLKSGE